MESKNETCYHVVLSFGLNFSSINISWFELIGSSGRRTPRQGTRVSLQSSKNINLFLLSMSTNSQPSFSTFTWTFLVSDFILFSLCQILTVLVWYFRIFMHATPPKTYSYIQLQIQQEHFIVLLEVHFVSKLQSHQPCLWVLWTPAEWRNFSHSLYVQSLSSIFATWLLPIRIFLRKPNDTKNQYQIFLNMSVFETRLC